MAAIKTKLLNQIKDLSQKGTEEYAGLKEKISRQTSKHMKGPISDTAMQIVQDVLSGAEADTLDGLKHRIDRLKQLRDQVYQAGLGKKEQSILVRTINTAEKALMKHYQQKNSSLEKISKAVQAMSGQVGAGLIAATRGNDVMKLLVKSGGLVNSIMKNRKAAQDKLQGSLKKDTERMYGSTFGKSVKSSGKESSKGSLRQTSGMSVGGAVGADLSVIVKPLNTISAQLQPLAHISKQVTKIAVALETDIRTKKIKDKDSASDSLEAARELKKIGGMFGRSGAGGAGGAGGSPEAGGGGIMGFAGMIAAEAAAQYGIGKAVDAYQNRKGGGKSGGKGGGRGKAPKIKKPPGRLGKFGNSKVGKLLGLGTLALGSIGLMSADGSDPETGEEGSGVSIANLTGAAGLGAAGYGALKMAKGAKPPPVDAKMPGGKALPARAPDGRFLPKNAPAPKSGMLGKAGKALGKMGGPLTAAFSVLDFMDRKDQGQSTGQAVTGAAGTAAGGALGAWGGAAAGAALGSVVPIVGTAIGGVVGGILGGIGGSWFGGSAADALTGAQSLEDALPKEGELEKINSEEEFEKRFAQVKRAAPDQYAQIKQQWAVLQAQKLKKKPKENKKGLLGKIGGGLKTAATFGAFGPLGMAAAGISNLFGGDEKEEQLDPNSLNQGATVDGQSLLVGDVNERGEVLTSFLGDGTPVWEKNTERAKKILELKESGQLANAPKYKPSESKEAEQLRQALGMSPNSGSAGGMNESNKDLFAAPANSGSAGGLLNTVGGGLKTAAVGGAFGPLGMITAAAGGLMSSGPQNAQNLLMSDSQKLGWRSGLGKKGNTEIKQEAKKEKKEDRKESAKEHATELAKVLGGNGAGASGVLSGKSSPLSILTDGLKKIGGWLFGDKDVGSASTTSASDKDKNLAKMLADGQLSALLPLAAFGKNLDLKEILGADDSGFGLLIPLKSLKDFSGGSGGSSGGGGSKSNNAPGGGSRGSADASMGGNSISGGGLTQAPSSGGGSIGGGGGLSSGGMGGSVNSMGGVGGMRGPGAVPEQGIPGMSPGGGGLAEAAASMKGMSTRDGPGGGRVSCVYAVNKVFASAGMKPPWGSAVSVKAAEAAMQREGWQQVAPGQHQPGDVWVAPAPGSHIGIVTPSGNVLSNSSSKASFTWEAPVEKVAAYYNKGRGGLGRFYRPPQGAGAAGGAGGAGADGGASPIPQSGIIDPGSMGGAGGGMGGAQVAMGGGAGGGMGGAGAPAGASTASLGSMPTEQMLPGGGMGEVPGGGDLGSLSAKYESGKRGSSAVGYDSTGGTSYGKYQIATKTGTMNRFMDYLKENNPAAYQRLAAAGPADAGKDGKFAQEWKAMAEDGTLGNSEHDFIKKTHYDVGMKGVKNEGLQKMLSNNKALQEVMWSTSVQHGGGGASSIFNKAYKEGMSEQDLIKAVYANRSTKFGSSNANVRQSVMNRFADEQQKALAMSQNPDPGSVINPDQIQQNPPIQLASMQQQQAPKAYSTVMNKSPEMSRPQAPVMNVNNVNNSRGGGGQPAAAPTNHEPNLGTSSRRPSYLAAIKA